MGRSLLAICIIVVTLPLQAAVGQELIGISVPLSGEAATYGTDIKNSIEFANKQLAGGRYRFVIEDDRCSGKEAVSAAHKLIEIDKVQAVLGFGCSGALLSAAPIYERAKTPVIASGASSAAVTQAGDYIFRTVPSDALTTKMLFDYVVPRHKLFAVLSEESEYSQTLASEFRRHNAGALLRLVEHTYLTGTADFRPQLLRLRSAGVDGLFLNTQAEGSMAVLVKQIKELGWQVPLYGVYYPSSPAFLNALGRDADGMVFVDLPGREALTPEGAALFGRFTGEYGAPKSSDCFFYTAFSSFAALHQALASRVDIRTYLVENSFESVFGPFSFDKNGDILGLTHAMKVIRSGKPELLKGDKEQ